MQMNGKIVAVHLGSQYRDDRERVDVSISPPDTMAEDRKLLLGLVNLEGFELGEAVLIELRRGTVHNEDVKEF